MEPLTTAAILAALTALAPADEYVGSDASDVAVELVQVADAHRLTLAERVSVSDYKRHVGENVTSAHAG